VDGFGRPTPMPPYRVDSAGPPADEPEVCDAPLVLSERAPALRGAAGDEVADEVKLSGRKPRGPEAGGGEVRVRGRRARFGGEGDDWGDFWGVGDDSDEALGGA
jgi:hypothetical protein